MKNIVWLRGISLLLFFAMACTLASCAQIINFAISQYTFEYEEVEGGYEVRAAFQNMAIAIKVTSIDWQDLVMDIPSEYNGKPVVSIADGAFENYIYLYKVNIPDTVKRIGDNAFKGCLFLSECEVPRGVTEIGDSAFYNCVYLKNIVIPDTVTSIGDYAFFSSACYMNEETGKEIIDEAKELPFFRRDLIEVKIPAGVETIGDCAFGLSTSIKGFNVDENNQYYKSIDGVLYSKDGTALLQYPLALENESFDIPASVQSIENYAFAESDNLVNVNISEGSDLRRIGDYAFFNMDKLSSFRVPEKVESLGDYSFANCMSLQGFGIDNPDIKIGKSIWNLNFFLFNIFYAGTKNQFIEILDESQNLWGDMESRSYIVSCSNGVLMMNTDGKVLYY